MKKNTSLALLALTLTVFAMNVSAQELGWQAKYFIGEINKVKTAFENNNPNEGFRLAQYTNDDWVKISMSKNFRAKYYISSNINKLSAFEQAEIDKTLDSLAIHAARALENWGPLATTFAFKNPAYEKMIKTKLANLATLKIHKSGFSNASWQIQTNNYGLPRLRFKRGYIYAKDSQDDHKFCHLYYISVNQDYAGGGTYGSAYPSFVSDTLVHCPK